MENVNIHSMIKERFAKLPPKLQEAITSTEVAEKLRALSQKYRLHLDQGQILENETYMVLLGIEKAEKYEENLKKELKITPEIAKSIANDVAKEIFLSIRNVLKESTTPVSKSNNTPISIALDSVPTPVPEQQTQPSTQAPVSTQNKLESVVRNQSKELEIKPAKKYTIDPYREPIN